MAVSSAPTATGTNIDVAGIVGKLMTVEQKPLAALNAKETGYQAKISAFGQVKAALSAFQSAVQGLSNTSKFLSNTATSSDADVVSASVMPSAAVGTHAIEVRNLAQSERLTTAGVISDTLAIGTGTVTFDLGSVTNGVFNESAGQYRATTLNNAAISNGVIPAKRGEPLPAEALILTPDTEATGTIPEGTLTLNGVAVGEINLNGIDNAQQIAQALNAANVEAGGQAGLFTADAQGNLTKRADNGKPVQIARATVANDPESASAALADLAEKTGLSPNVLGTQAIRYASVTVASTAGLTAGDAIAGGGFPVGATIAQVIDSTHFIVGAPGDESKNVTLQSSSTSGSQTVTIDSSNNTLQGIRDAINNAKIGVTASIVNDGSGIPYRLVLTSEGIGANNRIKINVNGDSSLANLLNQDPVGEKNLTEVTQAKDALVVIDGIPINKSSNTLNDVIQGMTLTLHQASTEPTTVTVSHDTAAVQTSVEAFVKSYNDLSKVIKDLTAFNLATKKGGPLQGDSAMRSLESQLNEVLGAPLNTPAGSLTALSQIGVTKQTDGSLSIEAGKLSNSINTQFNDVAGLFAAIGKSSDNLVKFKSNQSQTVPGTYGINVSALATQGVSVGNVNLLRNSTTIQSGTTFDVTVDGTRASVALSAGTYNPTQLASMLQSAINGNETLASAGKSVSAGIDNEGHLSVFSSQYGSGSSVTLSSESGTDVSRLMGSETRRVGTDIVGSIDGEVSTGKGQTLISRAGPSNGLEVQITGGALGDRGTVNYTQGYAYKLNEFANKALGNTGVLSGRMDGLTSSVRSLSKERDTLNTRLASTEERYRRQYSKLDTMLGNMNKTSTYLSQQLAKM